MKPGETLAEETELVDPEVGWRYDGWEIRKPFEGYAGLFKGYMQYGDGSAQRGGSRARGLFRVRYADGEREVDSLTALRPFMVSEAADGSHRAPGSGQPTAYWALGDQAIGRSDQGSGFMGLAGQALGVPGRTLWEIWVDQLGGHLIGG